ncbi:galactose-1-phosphate uridylyltransferase [Fodinicola acaciae]|uniref:galactose-1-phosphate uridylyltransferase n=1 Tax=Fodinicola acaciae TaxID=2681555 RepID=UPI001C9E5250|nr:galactose-1-phosphate uridylyltransferase [Fodinicola acaciae]
MADGREIIYFDETDDAVRELSDKRDLPPAHTNSQIRYDPLLDEWVAIASHRQSRTFLPPTSQCPLCPSTPDRLTEIPSSSYDVVVFENRFPSFTSSAADEPVPGDDGTLVTRRPGAGRCEVVCFTSDHNSSFAELTPARARTVVDVWADRTAALSALPFVEQVFCFENRGEEIGVTLAHPHGQIYAYPFVTPRTRRMLDSARRHRERTGENLFARVLADERAGERVVASNDNWTAFVPAFARWPFEVHLYPHRQVAGIPELSGAERDDFAAIYLDVLQRFDALFDAKMPYIAAWHQAPARVDRDLAYLHLQLFSIRREAGKLKYLAGSESGMGVFINDIPPERSAALLREATTR